MRSVTATCHHTEEKEAGENGKDEGGWGKVMEVKFEPQGEKKMMKDFKEE